MMVSLAAALGACDTQRTLTLVSVLPRPCGTGTVNALRVRGLGDFAPEPAQTAAIGPGGAIELSLPRGARVITIEGVGPAGLGAFGRTAPVEIPSLWEEGGAAPVAALAYGPVDSFCETATLAYARSDHRATLLIDGSVLLTGGVDRDGNPVVALERYLPTGDATSPIARFTPIGTGDLLTTIDKRAVLGHEATRLADGRVLISGGAPALNGLADGIAYQGARLLLPDGRAEGAPLVLEDGPRAQHASLLLGDGRVLLAGGCSELVAGGCAAGRLLDSVALYDPAKDAFELAPPLLVPRAGHRAIFRDDGLVLIVGGRGESGVALQPELYDPTEARGATLAGPAGEALALDSGLLIALNDAGGPSARATSWSGRDEAPRILPQLPTERVAGTLTALEDGAVLFAGGWDGQSLAPRSAVLGPYGPLTELSGFAARGHTATRLRDGTVLLAGGIDASGNASATATLFLRSLVGPFETPATLSFDDTLAITPSRPERMSLVGGALVIDAGMATRRPESFALVSGAELSGPSASGFELSVLVGRSGPTEAAILFGDPGRGRCLAILFSVGARPRMLSVKPDRPGLPSVEEQAGCETFVLEERDLPEVGFATLLLSVRHGGLELGHGDRTLLRCSDAGSWAPARGFVALGASGGRVRYDNAQLAR